jgi:hypothetical protein
MTRLSTNQIELLRSAASADDGAAAATDDTRIVRALIKRGLLIALPQADRPSRLLITQSGRAAVAEPETPLGAPAQTESENSTEAETALEPPTEADRLVTGVENPAAEEIATAFMPKGKLGIVVGLLKRPEGAVISELMSATGWQAHSVRGAMSGAIKKKLGLAILSVKTIGGRVYRIADEAQA